MSSQTFVTLTSDEILRRNNLYWCDALEALRVPAENDEGPVSPITAVMPYRIVYRAYTEHLETCTECAEGCLWDECPEGDRLSGLAADAMAAQGDLALQN